MHDLQNILSDELGVTSERIGAILNGFVSDGIVPTTGPRSSSDAVVVLLTCMAEARGELGLKSTQRMLKARLARLVTRQVFEDSEFIQDVDADGLATLKESCPAMFAGLTDFLAFTVDEYRCGVFQGPGSEKRPFGLTINFGNHTATYDFPLRASFCGGAMVGRAIFLGHDDSEDLISSGQWPPHGYDQPAPGKSLVVHVRGRVFARLATHLNAHDQPAATERSADITSQATDY